YHHLPPSDSYTPSLHDALPISARQRPCMLALVSTADLPRAGSLDSACREPETRPLAWVAFLPSRSTPDPETLQHFEAQHVEQERSEEHTSELQSLAYLVCRLLL